MPPLIKSIYKEIDTNMTSEELISLINTAKNSNKDPIMEDDSMNARMRLCIFRLNL